MHTQHCINIPHHMHFRHNFIQQNKFPCNLTSIFIERGKERMKGVTMRALILVCLVSTIVVQSTTALNLGCVAPCMFHCLKSGNSYIGCIIQCTESCHHHKDGIDPNQYCLIGCGISLCNHLAKEGSKAGLPSPSSKVICCLTHNCIITRSRYLFPNI